MKLAFVGLAALAAALSVAQTNKGSYMNASMSRVEYDYPTFLTTNPTITTTTLGDGRKQVKFQFSQNFVAGANHISLEMHFDAIAGGSKFDRIVVAALGGYTYKSSPAVTAGNAGVIKTADYTKVGAAEVQVDGSAVYIRYAPSLVNNASYNAIQLRYFPSTIGFSNLAGDLNSIVPLRYYLDSTFNVGTKLPDVPSPKRDDAPISPPPAETTSFFQPLGSLFAIWDEDPPVEEDPEDPTEEPELIIILPTAEDLAWEPEWIGQGFPGKDAPRPGGVGWGEIKMPPTYGIGKGDGEPPNRQFQPVPNPRPADIIPVDADGNGIQDYILPGHDPIPYTDLMQGYYLLDDQTIVSVIGRDTNKNGRIDPNEIIAPTAECQYTLAMNQCKLWIKDGQLYIVWENMSIDSSKTPKDVYDGNKYKTAYFYNVDTGVLMVKKYDLDGKLLKWVPGPPPAWIINPNQDDPNGSWVGPAKDYPGWVNGGRVPRPPTPPGGGTTGGTTGGGTTGGTTGGGTTGGGPGF